MKFLNHLTFGQYVPADSFIHSMDPRAKILGTVSLLTGVFLVEHPSAFIIWFLLLMIITFLSKLSYRLILGSARPVLILVIFTALIHLFFTTGTPVFSIGFLKVSREGITMGVYMGIRLLLLVFFAS
ncbi:MAG TPA: energy-coupling factor transporter transmembrane component T, partial [Synergistales bacterium]|nr:energy-coupling factor transporter transmembrane component T [Synergistales bacterium]